MIYLGDTCILAEHGQGNELSAPEYFPQKKIWRCAIIAFPFSEKLLLVQS